MMPLLTLAITNTMIRIFLYLVVIYGALTLANRCNPGPGDADVRGPAKTVEACPCLSLLHTSPEPK